jgi:hypothetical protein
MPLLLVALLSLLVGAVVYVGTLRRQQAPAATGFGEPEPEASATSGVGTQPIGQPGGAQPVGAPGGPNPGYTYLQVSTQGPRIRDRLQGIVGVIVLLGVGAAGLAFVLYELGHFINRMIERFLD